MITFGGALTLCQLFWIIQSQSDIFIAGRVFSVYELGLYSEALFLTLIVTGRFIPPLNDVAFPAYAELHKAGRSLGPYFERTMQSVLLVVTPIYIGLALTAPEAILVVFGEKWTGMAPIVSGLAIVMPLMAVQIICSPTCTATGKEGIYLATSIAGAILFAGSFFIGVQFGAQGLVRAWWVAAPLLLIFTLALTLPQIDLPLRRLGRRGGARLPRHGRCGRRPAAPCRRSARSPRSHCVAGAATYAGMLYLVWPDIVRQSIAMIRRTPADPLPTAAATPAPAGRTRDAASELRARTAARRRNGPRSASTCARSPITMSTARGMAERLAIPPQPGMPPDYASPARPDDPEGWDDPALPSICDRRQSLAQASDRRCDGVRAAGQGRDAGTALRLQGAVDAMTTPANAPAMVALAFVAYAAGRLAAVVFDNLRHHLRTRRAGCHAPARRGHLRRHQLSLRFHLRAARAK